MSKESVNKLIEIAENNLVLRNRLAGASGPEAIIAIAAEENVQFTETELLEVMQERQLSFASEEGLSEEQLEAVVGGKSNKSFATTKADTYSKTKA